MNILEVGKDGMKMFDSEIISLIHRHYKTWDIRKVKQTQYIIRVERKKYCAHCNAHTVHKQTI